MKEDGGEELAAALAKIRSAGGGRGRGYPDELRARAVAYTQKARARGETIENVAASLGLSATTLSAWLRPVHEAAKFAPVKVVAPTRIVIVSPSGWRAEIDLSTFAKLVAGRS